MLENEPVTGTEGGLKRWLEGIGLSHYTDLFAQHRLDLDVMGDLTESDLVELGLPLGDRKRLQRAMSALFRAETAEKVDATARPQVRTEVGAERRQLTTMFCDMVDSTSLSVQFDPEDVRDMIASFRETCVRVVKHYEGFAARFVGDGILVYFGYPTAHEDDAERAVRAGLEIVRVLSTAREIEPRGALSHSPAVRIGIATGIVVVGDLVGQGTEERDSAVGETVNLAARLQGLAPPNGVVISTSTQSLLKGKFDYRDLGVHALKGISEKAQAWHVMRASRVETRFAADGALAAGQGGRGPGRGQVRRARHRQVAHHPGNLRAHRGRSPWTGLVPVLALLHLHGVLSVRRAAQILSRSRSRGCVRAVVGEPRDRDRRRSWRHRAGCAAVCRAVVHSDR
jgi:class 3 adenylate cyclase